MQLTTGVHAPSSQQCSFMAKRKYTFSLRSLACLFALFAVALSLLVRFGPHIVWRLRSTRHFEPIPTKQLAALHPIDQFATWDFGPISFDLPKAMRPSLDADGAAAGPFSFVDPHGRSLVFVAPSRSYVDELTKGYPDKATLTFPRLYSEMVTAASDDFSFGMSLRDLEWHRRLLEMRAVIQSDVQLVQNLWRPSFDANLISRGTYQVFQWETVDRRWSGRMHFTSPSVDDTRWVEHACNTFSIAGDLNVFQTRGGGAITPKLAESGRQ